MNRKLQQRRIRVHHVAKSALGIVSLFWLTCAAAAQDEAPGYAPGSIPNQPFSLLKDNPSSKAWIPPVTESPAASEEVVPAEQPLEQPPAEAGFEVVEEPKTESVVIPPVAAPPTAAPIDSPPAAKPPVAVPPAAETKTNPMQAKTPAAVPSIPEPLAIPPQEPIELPEANPISDEPQTSVNDLPQLPSDLPEASEELHDPDFFQNPDESLSQDLPVLQEHSTDPFGESSFSNQQQAARPFAAARKLPFNTPVRNMVGGLTSKLAGNNGVHAVGQLTFLSFARDYRNKGRVLSNGTPNMLANGPDEGNFTGVDINYGRRRAEGRGWEMRYIGFNPDQATDVAAGATLVWGGITPPLNDPSIWGGAIPLGTPETFGLSGIGTPLYSMADVFEDARNHRVSRDSEFGSFEFNLLRAGMGGRRLSCGNANVEFFGGLRGVAFNETTVFTAAATQGAIFPRSGFYSSEVKNSLFGLQVGGRLQRQLQRGWGYTFGTRVGIYNNRVESRQRAEVQFGDGSTVVPQILYGPDEGRAFDLSDTDNELAFLGELDFGITYHFRPQTRARFGFRGIAVTNIADAAGQFEDNLYEAALVAEPKAWGDLIVGGLYFGVDHSF